MPPLNSYADISLRFGIILVKLAQPTALLNEKTPQDAHRTVALSP